MAFVIGSFVDPTTVFEVGDGDTITGNSSANCDWNTLNGTLTVDTNTPAGVCAGGSAALNAYVFLNGSLNEKNFTGGGSKDPIDIARWRWSNGSTPDKDTLTHGYAASYSAGGHKILVFGAERFAVNGDANIGVWFFQQPVAPNASGGFDGAHINGDVFAVSAFTNGGSHPGLDVYTWDSGCSASNYSTPTLPLPTGGTCAATNLRLIFSGAAGSTDLCSSDAGCTSVNGSEITPSWPYNSKFGGTGPVPVNAFFEGGFDLTAIFPGGSPGCFSSFLVETRSSQSPSAVLKDFLSGAFPECHVSIAKACACATAHPDAALYDYSVGGTVTNDGGGTIFNVTVSDPSINGTYSCGSIDKGVTKKWGAGAGAGDCTGGPGAFTSSLKPATNQASVVANTSSSGTNTITGQTALVTCSVPAGSCNLNAAISVTKACVTGLQILGSNVVVRVDYTGLVSNAGSDNLNNVTVVDAANGTPASQTFTIGTLTPAQAKCYTNGAATCPNLGSVAGATPVNGVASYFPSTFTDLGTGASGRGSFTDQVMASGTDPYGVTKTATANATCVVCPLGVCPAN